MNPERLETPAQKQPLTTRGLCLCAEMSFDGKLLNALARETDAPLPSWWTRLLARRHSQPADAHTVRALLDSNRVTELCLRIRPCIDGRADQPALSGTGSSVPFFARSITWNLARMAAVADGSCLLHYRRIDE